MRRSPALTETERREVDEEQGPGRRPDPSPARRLLVAIFAFALATAGIAFAIRTFRSGTVPAIDESVSDEVSVIPPLTGEPRITAEIPLVDEDSDAGAGGIAVGDGSAWVGIQRGGSGFVVRIDLATNEVVAEIPVQESPWRKRIAATDEAVWVASRGVLERIDPDTNTVVATVDLHGRPISAITADSSDVWAVAVTEPSREGGEWTGSLVRVDATTNEVVAEIALGPQVAGYEDEVMVGAGSVWVLGVRWFEEQDAEYGSDLIRVDPATNAIATRIPVGGFHMVMGDGEVWVRFMADGVFDTYDEQRFWTRVDVRTNEPSNPFELAADGLKFVASDALWAVGYDEQQNVRVSRLDPQTLQVEANSEPIRSLFTDAIVDAASRTVWVSAIYSVVRLDIVAEPSAISAPPEGRLLLQVADRVEVIDEDGTRQVLGDRLFALDLSPDGSMALVATNPESDGASAELLTVDLARGERSTIATTGAVPYPARWSPDGSKIAYREDDVLCVVPTDGATPMCMPGLGRVYWFDWAPDGQRLVLGLPPPEPLTVLHLASGEATALVPSNDEQVLSALEEVGFGRATRVQFESPKWSSSGQYIATLAMVFETVSGREGNVVFVFDAAGHLVAGGKPMGEYSDARAWSPTADVFAYGWGGAPYEIVEARALDPASGQDTAVFSTQDVARGTVRELAWSPSGRWLVVVAVTAKEHAYSTTASFIDATTRETVGALDFPDMTLTDWGP